MHLIPLVEPTLVIIAATYKPSTVEIGNIYTLRTTQALCKILCDTGIDGGNYVPGVAGHGPGDWLSIQGQAIQDTG